MFMHLLGPSFPHPLPATALASGSSVFTGNLARAAVNNLVFFLSVNFPSLPDELLPPSVAPPDLAPSALRPCQARNEKRLPRPPITAHVLILAPSPSLKAPITRPMDETRLSHRTQKTRRAGTARCQLSPKYSLSGRGCNAAPGRISQMLIICS